jgi:hypothetical protein
VDEKVTVAKSAVAQGRARLGDEKLGRGDELGELDVSSFARAADATLPKTWRVRAIRSRTPVGVAQEL